MTYIPDSSEATGLSKRLEMWNSSSEPLQSHLKTYSGTPIKPIYTPIDVASINYLEHLGLPDEFPYTRGYRKLPFAKKRGVLHSYMGHGNPGDANKRIKKFLKIGKEPRILGASVALDLPTQIGLNPSNHMSQGEVGRLGVSLFCANDVKELFLGVPLNRVAYVSTTANAIGPTFAAWYIVACKALGYDPAGTRLFFQNDILKEYCARGTYIVPVQAGLKLACDTVEYVTRNFPSWSPLLVCSYHMREAGVISAAEEIGLGFANALAYIDELVSRGFGVPEVVPVMRFHPVAGMDLLEEAAKHRAARRLWARLISERYHCDDPRALKIRIQTSTSGLALTRSGPLNNIVRVTIGALAAFLGGADDLSCRTFDEGHSIPSEEAQKVSVRTQQIITYESGVTSTIDPLGGSYYVEWLTSDIEEKAREIIDKVEDLGGAVRAIEKGFYHRLIMEGLQRFHEELARKERIIVGLNEFIEEDQQDLNLVKYNDSTEKRAIARLRKVKAGRDESRVKQSLDNLKAVCKQGGNVMPAMIETVRTQATLEEIWDVFREHYGEQQIATGA